MTITKKPRTFGRFVEGQTVTDNRTGKAYTLHGIQMRGDGAMIAYLFDGVSTSFEKLSRFYGSEAA